MDFTSLLFPILILALFIPIFLSGRRQRRQVVEMQALQAALEPGDVVMTTSGLRATVVDSSYEETVDLEIADGVVTTWVRAAVREKVAAGADDQADYADDDAADDTAAVHGSSLDSPLDPPVASPPSDGPSLEKVEKKNDSANGSTTRN